MNQAKRKRKVLVVDDSDVILNSLKNFFEDYNFEVTTCSDGLEGIQRAAELKPDLIFLDLMMPNLDGLKMLQVKNVLGDIKDIPVIVISANTVRKNVLAAVEAGADRVISKPLKKDLIIEYVNELIGGENFKGKELKKNLTENESKKIKTQLVSFFLEAFNSKKKMMQEAIRSKNVELLKMAVHEIKGAGGTMGYPELTDLSREIEEKEFNSLTDWVFAELKSNQIFKTVEQIEENIHNSS